MHSLWSEILPTKKALILGAGRSGMASARLLLHYGCEVLLYDDKSLEHLPFFRDNKISDHQKLTTCFGKAFTPDITNVDAVILSPGIDLRHDLVVKAQQHSLLILSEIDLASIFLPHKKMLGITGTNGKSTTTVMIESILRHANKQAIACGNLGLPLCDVIMDYNTDDLDYLVIELSSFQLESLRFLRLDRALITNITFDHLDRYKDFLAYKNAKYRIANLLNADGVLIAHRTLSSEILLKSCLFFAEQDYGEGDFSYLKEVDILGSHNKENAVAAAMLAHSLGCEKKDIIAGLNNFRPLPHRCEKIGVKNGITFINDSKGTTVVSVIKALSMFKEAKTHLLLGGIDKGEDFSLLSQNHFPDIGGYYIFGRATPKILSELSSPIAYPCSDLNTALKKALEHARPGDIVLLSPGCASYDQFNNYQHRGEMFQKLVDDHYGNDQILKD